MQYQPIFSAASSVLVETNTVWRAIPELNDHLSLIKWLDRSLIVWSAFENVCLVTLAVSVIRGYGQMKILLQTCKAMSHTFLNEYHTFSCLFEYISDNVFKMLEFVFCVLIVSMNKKTASIVAMRSMSFWSLSIWPKSICEIMTTEVTTHLYLIQQ